MTALFPVERGSVTLPVGARTGRIVALDAAIAPSVITVRPDVSGTSLSELMAPLAAARPTVAAVPLPGSPDQLRLTVDLGLRTVQRSEYDDATGEDNVAAADPAEVADWKGLGTSIVVRDATGLLHRLTAPTVTIEPGPHELVIPLGAGSVPGASFAYPLELFAVDLGLSLPSGYSATDATVTVHDVAAAGDDAAWRPVSLDLADGWRTTASLFGGEPQIVTERASGPELVAAVGQPHLDSLPGSGLQRPRARADLRPDRRRESGHDTRSDHRDGRLPRGDREQGGRRDHADHQRRSSGRSRSPGPSTRSRPATPPSRRRSSTWPRCRCCDSRATPRSSRPMSGGCRPTPRRCRPSSTP